MRSFKASWPITALAQALLLLALAGPIAVGCVGASDWDESVGSRALAATDAEVPGLPVLIALGDSITSGHHGGGTTLVCDDPSYGYPATVFSRLENRDGENWYRPEQYVNLAHSGFGTNEVLNGGTNYCGARFNAPIADAVAQLRDHVNSVVPNRVVISVGINNTNWTTVLTGIAKIYALNQMPGMTAAQCEDVIKNGYNSFLNTFPAYNGDQVWQSIVDGVIDILNQLVAADPHVQIAFVGYYNMANTGFSNTDNSGPYSPAVCNDAVASRQYTLNTDWILEDAILVSNAVNNTTFIDPGLDGQNNKLQQLTGNRGIGISTTGWPHPNPDGHAAIAALIVP